LESYSNLTVSLSIVLHIAKWKLPRLALRACRFCWCAESIERMGPATLMIRLQLAAGATLLLSALDAGTGLLACTAALAARPCLASFPPNNCVLGRAVVFQAAALAAACVSWHSAWSVLLGTLSYYQPGTRARSMPRGR
jgi:hypothetical protein